MEIEYKNIDEQIELIKAKNILIKNEEKAKKVLLRENYYNLITSYKDIFINMKMSKKTGIETCEEETYFEEIYAVYKFDRDLRNLMFKYISIIETNIKSYICNVFSERYGTQDYLVKENFDVFPNSEGRFNILIKSINDNVARNIENYPELKESYQKTGYIPFWILDTVMTFGNIVKFYVFMKTADKMEIAKLLDMNYKEVQSYLKMLNIVRNISAHNNVLFNLKCSISYSCEYNSRYHDILGIKKADFKYTSGINDIMAVIIVLRRFLEDKEYHHLQTELIEMINEVKEELDSESFENLLEEMGIPIQYTKLEIL